jgi:hypothetical protein
MTKHRSILISTKKYWVKTLVNHQSNWAVMDDLPDELGVRVWFFDIEGWISDYLDFLSHEDAEVALLRNSFKKHSRREFGSLGYPAGNFLWWMPEKPSERPYSTGHHWTD